MMVYPIRDLIFWGKYFFVLLLCELVHDFMVDFAFRWPNWISLQVVIIRGVIFFQRGPFSLQWTHWCIVQFKQAVRGSSRLPFFLRFSNLPFCHHPRSIEGFLFFRPLSIL